MITKFSWPISHCHRLHILCRKTLCIDHLNMLIITSSGSMNTMLNCKVDWPFPWRKLTIWNLLGGDKVSMLTHTYPRERESWKWPSAITRLTVHFTCCLISDLVLCKYILKNSVVIHDTEYPYWDQVMVSLDNADYHLNRPVLLDQQVMSLYGLG